MIKRWNEFIKEEFIDDSINIEYIESRMQEFDDLISDTSKDEDWRGNLTPMYSFEWSIDKETKEFDEESDIQGQLNICLYVGGDPVKFEFDLDELRISKIVDDEEVEFSENVSSIDEGLDIVEKEIYYYLGVSESKFEDREPTGKRIKLVRMEDPYTNLKPGDEGVCTGVDDMGHILMKWDNGSTLSMLPEVDEFDVIDESIDEGEFKNTDESLKQKLIDYYYEKEAEYGEEEIANVIEILNGYGDNLSGLGKYDKILLLRLIDDDELYQEVDDIGIGEIDSEDRNLFDNYVYESKILGYEILPSEALEELKMYVDYDNPENKIEVVEDPRVEGTYAVRVYRKSDDYTFDLLWYKGGYDEVEFEQWPPISGELRFW